MNETQQPDIEVTRPPEAPAPRSFAEMNLDPAVKQALDEMGYEIPMEVQTAVYPRFIAGGDLIVQSRTGSGKTAAFGIPIAQMIPPGQAGVQALCLAPTRELALQIASEVSRIIAYRNLQVVPVYGGAPMGRQVDALKAGAQIVAGTPGRVLDHIRRGTLKTGQVRILVLDECDEMLSMGFQEEIEKIIAELPPKDRRQTLLFSATVPEEIERIGKRHMRTYEKVTLSEGYVGTADVTHHYYMVSGLSRTRDLLTVMKYEQPQSAIIFCNTRDDVSLVASFLQRHGMDAEPISSDLTQSERERVMQRMRDKNLPFLVATDIAARGIDISDLSHVINYTFPDSPEVYVHRTGRTGRAGKKGTAISLIGPREIGPFYYLKLIYKIKPEERELPSAAELQTRREGERYTALASLVSEEPGDEWRALARRVLQSAEGERLVAASLKRAFESGVQGAPRELPMPARPAAETASTGQATERPVRERPPRDRDRERQRRDRRDANGRTEGPSRGRDRGGRGERGERDRDRERRPRRGEETPAAAAAPVTAAPATEAPAVATAPVAPVAPVVAAPPAPPAAPVTTTAAPAAETERPRRERTRRAESAKAPEGGTREEREFWEAWVDERRASESSQAAPTGAPAAAPADLEVDIEIEDETAQGAETSASGEREGRRRSRRTREELPSEAPGYVRLYVNVGKREGLTSDELSRLVKESSPALVPAVSRVLVLGTHSYLSVREEAAGELITGLSGKKVGDRDVVAERAKK